MTQWLIKLLLKASLVDGLWIQTGFTPKAPGTYIFYGSEFFMTLELSVSDVEKPADFSLSLHYIY